MRTGAVVRGVVACGTLGCLVLGITGAAGQQSGPVLQNGLPSASQSQRPSLGGHDPFGSANPTLEPDPRRLEHMREDDRRKRLLSDTAKLVQLSTELQTEVQKTSKDELSVDVVKRATEIEKLAHDVRERMRS